MHVLQTQQKQQQNNNNTTTTTTTKTVTAYNKGDSGSNYILTINTTTSYTSVATKGTVLVGNLKVRKTMLCCFFLSNLTQIP